MVFSATMLDIAAPDSNGMWTSTSVESGYLERLSTILTQLELNTIKKSEASLLIFNEYSYRLLSAGG